MIKLKSWYDHKYNFYRLSVTLYKERGTGLFFPKREVVYVDLYYAHDINFEEYYDPDRISRIVKSIGSRYRITDREREEYRRHEEALKKMRTEAKAKKQSNFSEWDGTIS